MLRRSSLLFALSFSAALLSGCGGAAETAQPAPSKAAATDKQHQFEAVKADCMKQQGFKYVPYVKPEKQESEEDRKLASGDYQAMRKYREKYGFGVFAPHVYPKMAGGMDALIEEVEHDPNAKIIGSLSGTQLTAYNKVKDTCVSLAGKQVLGLTLKSNIDYINQYGLARKRVTNSELDGDPQLLEQARSMATCLEGKGYDVSDTKPTAMADRGAAEFRARHSEVARKQNGGKEHVWPNFTPQQARPYLNEEIKAALDDLECGKDFYAAYVPRKSEIDSRISDQFAFRP